MNEWKKLPQKKTKCVTWIKNKQGNNILLGPKFWIGEQQKLTLHFFHFWFNFLCFALLFFLVICSNECKLVITFDTYDTQLFSMKSMQRFRIYFLFSQFVCLFSLIHFLKWHYSFNSKKIVAFNLERKSSTWNPTVKQLTMKMVVKMDWKILKLYRALWMHFFYIFYLYLFVCVFVFGI